VSTVWIVSLVLAWAVIALLVVVVLSLLRQLGEVRAQLAAGVVAAPAEAEDEGLALYDPLDPVSLPLLHDGGLGLGPSLAIGGAMERPVLLVVHAPGCESCEGIEDALVTIAAERPDTQVVSVLGLGEPFAREHAEQHPLDGVPTVAFDALPPRLHPESTPSVVGLAREGQVAVLGSPSTTPHLREAVAACDGAVLVAGPDSIRATVWGETVPAWGVTDSLDVVHVHPADPDPEVPSLEPR